MLEHEGDEEYKTFDFYHSRQAKDHYDVERDENGKEILFDGNDLPKLKQYIKETNDKKIQCLLVDAKAKGYLYCNRQGLPFAPSYYCSLELTDIGRECLKNLCKDKLENLKWIVTTFVAVIGLIFSILGYFYPNETKIQTIVKTELKNTTNVNISK